MAIDATVSLEEAAHGRWDVIVVGAGPAGSVAALELARRRLAVLLVDRAEFPRWKVCGCCINRCSQSTLRTLGLGDLLEKHGAIDISALRLSAQNRHASVPVPGEKVLSRSTFDAALVRGAIQAGAHFLPRTEAQLLFISENACATRLHRAGVEIVADARIILAADGLAGSFRKNDGRLHAKIAESAARIGAGGVGTEFPDFYQTGSIFMACGDGGYVGLVRIEDGRLNVAAALDPELVRREGGLAGAAAAILRQAGLPAIDHLASFSWRGTPLLTRSVSPPAAERIFLLGDAASYVEPFTGEGIAWALAGGAAVAPLVERACRQWDPKLVGEWARCYRRIITRRQWLCRTVAQVLRRPWLTRSAVTVLAHLPGLATPILRQISSP
jgi:menaquinone-9 beta-reductase